MRVSFRMETRLVCILCNDVLVRSEFQNENILHIDVLMILKNEWAIFSLISPFLSHLLGMTDDEILRAEMVSQLCMNDRTHSSLLDLISFTTYSLSDSVFICVASLILDMVIKERYKNLDVDGHKKGGKLDEAYSPRSVYSNTCLCSLHSMGIQREGKGY